MRVLIVGGTGVIGRRLTPLLVSEGHEVVATTTSAAKAKLIEGLGASPVELNVLDAAATKRAVAEAKPDAIVHQATSLSNVGMTMRNLDKTFATTNQLRTVGTANLLAAAKDVGVERFVAQSFCGWPFARTGGMVKTEEDPLDPSPPSSMAKMLGAIKELENMVGARGGTVLRYGGLYGPGTSMAPGGAQYKAVRLRMFPIVGDGGGYLSFLHVDDAAAATVAAVAKGGDVYNIVDDEPAPAREWLPYLAATIGAKPPIRMPVWLARAVAGEIAVLFLTQGRGGSNAKAKRELGWQPRYASWRDGFKTGLAS